MPWFFSGVFADVGFVIRFLRKETAWQVAPWLGAPGGAGQGLPVLLALIVEAIKWWAQKGLNLRPTD